MKLAQEKNQQIMEKQHNSNICYMMGLYTFRFSKNRNRREIDTGKKSTNYGITA